MIAIGYDWIAFFYPAIWLFLHGGDPYGPLQPHLPDRFFNPPWLLPLMVPFGLLPPAWGAWAVNAMTVAGVFALCVKYGKPWVTLAVVLSYPLADLLYHGSVEGFVLWGLYIGGPVGLFLLSTKPQVAGLVGLVWAIQAHQKSGWKGVVQLVAPTAILAAVFTAIYPQWISTALSARDFPGAATLNFWPWLIPVGVVTLVLGVRRLREDLLVLATNLLSPYLRAHSWIAAVVLFSVRYPKLSVPLALLSWLLLAYAAWAR